MGLNICLLDKLGRDVPEWDFARYAGDRDFARMTDDLPQEPTAVASGAFRPSDFQKWREAISGVEWPNPGRFDRLLDLVEADPGVSIYFSF